ncbi:hypothetical protein FBY34_5003 [Streptomyces sp. SLBN-115]|nr:hypothetical protein FBY34_5003 [Streptomyces sp. SLBN-115]
MPFPEHPEDPDRSVKDAVRRRERGRRRVSATTRWAAAAAAAGTAVLGAGYAHVIPGIAQTTAPAGHGSGTSTGTTGGLQPSGQAPTPTPQAPQTQSGAS